MKKLLTKETFQWTPTFVNSQTKHFNNQKQLEIWSKDGTIKLTLTFDLDKLWEIFFTDLVDETTQHCEVEIKRFDTTNWKKLS